MLGLMQDWPMTVDRIIDHAQAWHGDREIVSRTVEGPVVRTTYAEIHDRAKRLSSALLDLGIRPGDRVATLAWNTPRHLEAWYGIMGIGAVCHTLNPRLFLDQLCYIINHAQDRLILTDLSFLPTLLERRSGIQSVEHIVVLTDREHMPDEPGLLCYEDLIDQGAPDCPWGGFDENTACGLCYTSGTTGNPKGVLYSHRSNFLHTLVTLGGDVLGVQSRDVVMPVVPLFHANAWGLAFSAPAVGAKLVMPGARLDGPSVHEMLEAEKVTFAAAVPTVWQGLLQHLRETGGRLDSLERVVIGGSAPPEALVRAFQDEYGVRMNHAWGMTELSPFGTQTAPSWKVAAMDPEAQLRFQLKQGRPPLGMEMKLVDDAGERLPHDGKSVGRLKVRGPYVVREYFRGEGGNILDPEGFFDTSDVATIDSYGYMQITDRSKDVIKSGGEWISSIEIENLAMGHPKVLLAAVIGVAHPKWSERPLLLVKPHPGESITREEMLAFLSGKIARWWTPDEVLTVDEIPLGATGKIDKKLLRERFQGYELPDAAAPTERSPEPEEAAAGADGPFRDEPPAAPVPLEQARRPDFASSLAVFAAGVLVSYFLRRR